MLSVVLHMASETLFSISSQPRSTDMQCLYRPEAKHLKKKGQISERLGNNAVNPDLEAVPCVPCWAKTGAFHPTHSNLCWHLTDWLTRKALLGWSWLEHLHPTETSGAYFPHCPHCLWVCHHQIAMGWSMSSQYVSTYQLFWLDSVSQGCITYPKFSRLPPKVEEW